MQRLNKIRLVHVISSLERGGAQAVLHTIIANLKYADHVVVDFHDGPYRALFERLNIRLYHVQGIFHLFDFVALFRLTKLLYSIKPDQVHSLLWGANCFARISCSLLRIPLVSSLHNNIEQNGSVRIAIEKIVPAYGKMVAVSEQVKQSYISHFGLTPITVIKNGISVLPSTHIITRQ